MIQVPFVELHTQLSAQILSLPMYPELSVAQVDWVIESLNAFPMVC